VPRAAALPYFYFDCGTEDFFLGVNEQFAALLSAKKIAHEFHELPGNHGWQYWDQQVRELLKVAAEKLKAGKKLEVGVSGVMSVPSALAGGLSTPRG
jgi:S-formylglutathione hydrolase FrmB